MKSLLAPQSGVSEEAEHCISVDVQIQPLSGRKTILADDSSVVVQAMPSGVSLSLLAGVRVPEPQHPSEA